MTLLEIIRKKKFATATVATPATDKKLVLDPSVAKVASVAVAKQETHKTALPEDADREGRRQRVLKMLEDQPDIQRGFLTDTEADPKHVIVTIAIRGAASFEMVIPKDRYDPFLLLEIMKRGGVH